MSNSSIPTIFPRRSSVTSLPRRKPVPVFLEEARPVVVSSAPRSDPVEGSDPTNESQSSSSSSHPMSHSSSTSGSSISSLPPAYIPPPTDATARLPSYSSPSSSIRRNEATDVDSLADHLLPTYSEISQTEPWCLPRTLFFFGLIPFLGVFFAGLGAWVRWIDLDVGALNEGCHEELGEGIVEGQGRRAPQNGTEDRLREEVLKREKVVILRKAEIKWSTYCIYALVGQTILVVGIVVMAIALHFKKA